MVILDNNTMSDDQKTTQDEEKKGEHKPKTEESTSPADKKPAEEVKSEQDSAPEESQEEKDAKAALDEEIEKAEQEKPKKGKSQYKELKPEEIRPGMLVRVHQKIVDTNSKGEEKERIQVFQGMVLAHKHGSEDGSTITVRKVSQGIGVEKIFPLNMPSIDKIELVRTYKVSQAKPFYLRTTKKRLSEVKE